jgi:integrase
MVQRGQNKWLLRVYAGKHPDGRRKYISDTFEGTTSEARKALTAMQRNHDTRSLVSPSKTTLKEYLDGWVKGKIDVAPRTRVSYEHQLAFTSGLIGHLKLHEIDTPDVQAVVSDMAGKGLSPRTVEYSVRVLHVALEDAVKRHLLVRNPADHVTLPKKARRPPSILTMKQVDLLLEAAKDDPLRGLWALLLTTGLRPQEALALKWSDLDLDGKWLSVQRTVVNDGHGNFSLSDSTKTVGSTRRIGLPETAVQALRSHKQRQNASILLAGESYDRQNLVFANAIGGVADPYKVARRWKKALEAAELPEVRLYDTRHTHATALLQNGADIAWVKERLGHSNLSTTLGYAHVLPEAHRQMGEMTEMILKKAGGAAK